MRGQVAQTSVLEVCGFSDRDRGAGSAEFMLFELCGSFFIRQAAEFLECKTLRYPLPCLAKGRIRHEHLEREEAARKAQLHA